ncbi:uncharacterized protein LOC143218028 isoform X5 [Lasioglossum baleicum]|uniref:uncharacterized protein LOC143218028 isoform X5 n=1 Tax=Lasioglossum baleicum TaxID=434251 RepID=UPI003FCD41F1
MGNQFERSPRRKKKKKKQPQQRQHHQNGRHRRACNTHAPGTVHQKHGVFSGNWYRKDFVENQ